MTVSPTLDARFREAAAAAGLLDVAYDLAETPIGTLLVIASTSESSAGFADARLRKGTALSSLVGGSVDLEPDDVDRSVPCIRKFGGARDSPIAIR